MKKIDSRNEKTGSRESVLLSGKPVLSVCLARSWGKIKELLLFLSARLTACA